MLWPLGDHLGTLRDLASYDSGTDTTTIANHRVYDSFGNLVSETNAAVDELFGFTGRALDETTGLQNNWNRWYDARVGRWISEDPIGFAAGDANLARFVGNSATTFTDSSGFVAVGKPKEQPVEKVEIDRSDDGGQRIYVRQAPAEELREMGLSKSQVKDACEWQYIGDSQAAVHDTLGFQKGELVSREFIPLYEGDEVVGVVLVMSNGEKTWYGLPRAVKDKDGKWQIIGYSFYDDPEWLISDYTWYKAMRLFAPLMAQAAMNGVGLLGLQGSPARQSRGLR